MDVHRFHAEPVGDHAGVLAARAAEAGERIARHVVAARDGNLLDGVRHVLDRDGEEAVGDLLRRLADLGRERGEFLAHDLGVERLVLARTEDRREMLRHELADHDVGVGDGERPAAAIGGGAGIGAGGIGPDGEAPGLVMQDRAAAGRDGVDAHHRRAHPDARHLRLEGALKLAGVMRDVGRSAAHVEADDAVEARHLRRLDRADHAARRAGEDRVLALEEMRGGEPARRHHEHEAGRCVLRGSLRSHLSMREVG